MPIGLKVPTKSVKEGETKHSTTFYLGLNEPYEKEVGRTVPVPDASDAEDRGPLFNAALASSGFPSEDGAAQPLVIPSPADGGPGGVSQGVSRGAVDRTAEETAPLLVAPARRSEQPWKIAAGENQSGEVAIHLAAAEQPPDSITEKTYHHSSSTCFNFCGPNRAKTLEVLTLVLCIWCIVITGWHLSKKVMGLQNEVGVLKNDVEVLWDLTLENEDFDGRQMTGLRNEIHRTIRRVLADLEASQGNAPRRARPSSSTAGTRVERSMPEKQPSNGHDLVGAECVSEGGKACLFPSSTTIE